MNTTSTPEESAQAKIDAAQAELEAAHTKQRQRRMQISSLSERLAQDEKCLRELPTADYSDERRGLIDQLAGIFCEPWTPHGFRTERAIHSRISELGTIEKAVPIAKARLEASIAEAKSELSKLKD